MIKNIFPLITLLLLLPALIYSQNKTTINPEQYKASYDSLKNAKQQLLLEKQQFKNEIDSLKKFSADLDQKIKQAYADIYIIKYGKENGTRVAEGQIWKGMTDKMLRDSWGKPDKIDKTVYSYGVFTQWYYGKITYFFRDGKLTDWEEKK